MGACGFVLITKQIPGLSAESETRIVAGLLRGIGFIGGGAIIKENGNVRGLATAASIWVTGAIGAAGISAAARLNSKFSKDEIAVIEPSDKHFYQPFWTLVGGGIVSKEQSMREEKDFIPDTRTGLRTG
jgi:hypothetical protein